MNEHNEMSLSAALKTAIKKFGIEDAINETKLKQAWLKTVGEYVNSKTESLHFAKGKLNVKILSPAVKQELHYAKTDIVIKINAFFESDIVKELLIY